MGHCRRKICRVHLTDENQHKKLHRKDSVAFCGQVKAFPVGHMKCG